MTGTKNKMNNPIDKLFRDKLADHTQVPPAPAWARIETSLSKKNNGLLWFRMAAALLVLGIAVGAIAWLTSPDTPDRATQSQLSKVTEPRKIVAEKKQEVQKNENRSQKRNQSVTTRKKSSSPSPVNITTTRIDSVLAKKQSIPEVVTSPIKAERAPESVAVVEKTEKQIVLEYRLESIGSQESVSGQPQLAAAKEKKGLQKVLDFARDAKNSEGPLSELRQAKDEFFALNFRKDKQKNSK
jgi:hypothetical protein